MPVDRIKTTQANCGEVVRAAVTAINSGRAVIFPTDTVYGIAVHPDIPGAIERVYAFKQRDRGNPIALLASTAQAASRAGRPLCPAELRLANAFWPGALTLVLDIDQTTEAVRVPDHPLAIDIIAGCGGLLRVTSANVSGEPDANNGDDAAELIRRVTATPEFTGAPPLLIDGGEVRGGVPSSVVAVRNEKLHVLREGAIDSSKLALIVEIPLEL